MDSKAIKMGVLVCAAMAGVLLWVPAHRAQAWDGDRDELPGTWQVTTTQTDCQTGAPLPVPIFSALLSFHGNGTMTETTAAPAFAAGQRSIGLGVWRFGGERTFAVKSKALIEFTTPPTTTPPNPGFEAGSQILSQTITFSDHDRDHFSSAATTQFYDASGTEYRSGCATAVAERFE
jgi:hypothetical protein